MPRFRKRPVVIEAWQIVPGQPFPPEIVGQPGISTNSYTGEVFVNTLEGYMTAKPGDWIIKGVKGEFYPCKPNIFAATYEEVE